MLDNFYTLYLIFKATFRDWHYCPHFIEEETYELG